MKNPNLIKGWEGLSEYLGGMSISTLWKYEKLGFFKKRKLGGQVFFYKNEIDNAIVEQ